MAAGGRPVSTTVLVIDDDDDVRAVITDLLQDEGFVVHATAEPSDGLDRLDELQPDVVLLDIGMPSLNGLDLLTEIRRRGDVPVIFVTGRGAETDRVVGLRMGADDYVVKPFSSAELVARIHSVLRRSRPRETTAKTSTSDQSEVFDFDRLRVDIGTREVLLDGSDVSLTAREFDLLAFLVQAPRRVFSREHLLKSVWESSTEWQDPATVTEHVRRVRRKIEDDPDAPRWLVTVRGVGYRFEP